jgi:hypothetical protein
VSLSGDIPEAGSAEAERYLGRTDAPDVGRRFSEKGSRGVKRSGSKDKAEVSHNEGV